MPVLREGANNKRLRDDGSESPSEHSWQRSFKRMRVVEDDSNARFATENNDAFLTAVSTDEASCSNENPNGTLQFYSQHHMSTFPQQHQGYHDHSVDSPLHPQQQQQYSTNGSAHHPLTTQVPGQGSSEGRSINYQSMNSLLGSLHQSRRCQTTGAGQSTNNTSSHTGPQYGAGMTLGAYHHQSTTAGSPNTQQSALATHYSEAGTSSQYFRPSKKKDMSLRVQSNLY